MRIPGRFLPVLLCMLSMVPISSLADTPWRLVSERNGIQVYRQDDEQARIKTFRGVTRFEIVNPSALEALFNDYGAMTRWMHYISQVDEMSRSSYMERKFRATTHLPWPLQDRDVVVDLRVSQPTPDLLLIRASDDRMAPKDADYLRILEMAARFDFRFLPATREVEVTFEVKMDPGGRIPAWATNVLMKDMPYFTLTKLQRMVDEPKYRNYHGGMWAVPW